MTDRIQSIKGMHDHLPKDLVLWNMIERLLKNILLNYNYSEIRLPILENTKLFKKSIGDITDIIGKEMYSFLDKNNNSITLRPEATTSCVRSVIQHGLLHHKTQKLWYYGPMFRYERPQKGRYRQFYQFGIETFGFSGIDIELELIMIINKLWKKLNVSDILTLEINSIGTMHERIKYQKVLKNFLKSHYSSLDNHCIRQLKQNSLRILDSKNQKIQNLLLNAPKIINYINIESRHNFEKLCCILKKFNIQYNINHYLVRGLDYYNDIVFEWKTKLLGSKNTICAGGRYDSLVQQLGGVNNPAVGLAIGMDRLVLLLQTLPIYSKSMFSIIDIQIFFSSNAIKLFAFQFSEMLRDEFSSLKISLEFQTVKKSNIFKNLKKYSSKIILFIDDENTKNNSVYLYDFNNKTHQIVKFSNIIQVLKLIFCI